VNPASAGQTVNLQRLVGTAWHNQATVTIKKQPLPNGTSAVGFVFTVKVATASTQKYRIDKPATATLAEGFSSTLTVHVT
jgi:hypothetical protein